jgi:hypothetical protein
MTISDLISIIISAVALVLFVIVERNKLGLGKKRKPSKGKISESQLQLSEPELIDIEARAQLYSRILIGVILGISLGNLYVRYANTHLQSLEGNYYFHLTAASLLSLALTLLFIRNSPSLLSFFVHFSERFLIIYYYLYKVSSFVVCDRIFMVDGSVEIKCRNHFWLENLLATVALMILISYPVTPFDWALSLSKRKKIEPIG